LTLGSAGGPVGRIVGCCPASLGLLSAINRIHSPLSSRCGRRSDRASWPDGPCASWPCRCHADYFYSAWHLFLRLAVGFLSYEFETEILPSENASVFLHDQNPARTNGEPASCDHCRCPLGHGRGRLPNAPAKGVSSRGTTYQAGLLESPFNALGSGGAIGRHRLC
jgi:hypothetical protein